MRLIKIVFLSIIFIGFFASLIFAVSFNLPPEDETYSVLEELDAVGAVDSEIWGIKPFSEKEVRRLLAEARRKAYLLSPYLKKRVNELWQRFAPAYSYNQAFIKPFEDPYFFYVYSSTEAPIENFSGRTLRENNYYMGFQSKFFTSKYLLFHSQFEISYMQGEDNFFRGHFLAGYAKLGGNLFIEFGVDRIWWGEAYTGNLLFSLNPPPYEDLIKIGLENPIILPYFLRHLGLFKFSIAITQLEKERVVPKPWLIGMKINFKPHPRLEIGLSRSIMCGGEGRDISLSNILFASHENVYSPDPSEGDQKAGFEIRIRPIDHLLLYFEDAGEDEAGGLPSKHSYIFGFYAPSIFSSLGFRFEYARISKVWYHHHVYQSGYTYKNWLIGYYTDRTVENYFGEITYDITNYTRFMISYWRENHYNTNEQFLYNIARYQFGFIYHFSSSTILKAKYRFNDYSKQSMLEDNHQVLIQLGFKF